MKVKCAKCGITANLPRFMPTVGPAWKIMPRKLEYHSDPDEIIKYKWYCTECSRELRAWLAEVDKKVLSHEFALALPERRVQALDLL